MKRKIAALLLVMGVLLSVAAPAYAARPTHGTDREWITEDMLNTYVPDSYRINSATQGQAEDGKYNEWFLRDKLQTVSIKVDVDNLNYLLQNAKQENYVLTQEVTIGDVTLGYCGLRTKGNFTLQHAYDDNPGSDRFSFTVNFGEYVTKERFGEKQNFYGCDRISFNNFFFDKSMLKEFVALMLMEEMGLPTPQFGLAKLYINDRYYGVYAMVEAMDESILEQYYQKDDKYLSSYLCKPTGTRFRYDELVKDPAPLYEYDEQKRQEVADMLPVVLEWSRKLGCLAAGTDFQGNAVDVQSEEYLSLLGKVMDVEETVKYFAVQSFLCQLDNMFVGLQNFALYVSPEGVSTLLPWDYDLSFGCYFPSTAENTANYPVDVMYRLNVEMWGEESKHSEAFYKAFPLFYVIFQNDALMEQYHGYMLDCARIAALGGYVQTAEEYYPPAYVESVLSELEEPLVAAASEKLADNVYYMNNIRQPSDVKMAFPNILRVVAMRAAGVYNQITGEDAWVCGSGCNLETLGNAIRGENTTSGKLTVVDPYTGIMVTGTFPEGRRGTVPVLAVTEFTQTEATYKTAQELLQPSGEDALMVYQLKSAVKSENGYTVTMAPSADTRDNPCQIYRLVGKELVPVETTCENGLYTFRMDSWGTVVVYCDRSVFSAENPAMPVALLITVAVVLAGIAVTAVIVSKRSKQ